MAKGHRRVDLNAAEYEPLVHGGETVRLRLLAALLRFGDELDIDHRRVDLEQMKLLALPVESQLHWWKCHYVSGVSIADGYIRVSYRFPQDRPDYEGLIVPLVENDIRQKLADLEEIFWANGVKVALGKSQVRLMRLVQPLPPGVEALARNKSKASEVGTVKVTRWPNGMRQAKVEQRQRGQKVAREEAFAPEDERAALQGELARRKRNLYRLREQAAIYAAGERPLHLLNQIEAEEEAIRRIQAELESISVDGKSRSRRVRDPAS